MRFLTIFVCLAAVTLARAAYAVEDKYVGYYYPEVATEEVFDRTIADSPPAGKNIRVGFVTAITKAQLEAPESPRFVLFAKGAKGDQLVMIGLDDDVFKTVYRARAVLAQLTSNIRGTDFFRQQNLETAGTFFDMLQMMRFSSLVISDGETWAHRVLFKRGG